MNKLLLVPMAEAGPVAQQVVVKQDIQCDAGKPSSLGGKQRFTCQHFRMTVGKGINGPVMLQPCPHKLWQLALIQSPGKVPEQVAYPGLYRWSGEVQVCEVIHSARCLRNTSRMA